MTMTRPRLILAATTLALLAGCHGSGGGGPAPAGYSVGGTLSGLASGESVVLENNGADPQTVSAGGKFAFSGIALNGSYAITVLTPPAGQTCTVAGGSGTVTSASVANIVITCSDQAFSLGGTIQGLNGSGLVLANGTDGVMVSSGATTFRFPTAVAYTSSYAVTVKTQPDGLACAVMAGTGTMPAHAVTTVSVRCTDQPFTLGGTVSGLGARMGLVLKNGADTRSVAAGATSFVMPTAVDYDSPYAVTVESSPSGLTCTVVRGSGTMPAANVSNVAVTCADTAYTVGGSVMGLTTSGLVLANGSDTLTVPANASSFTMPTPVAYTSTYAVVVRTQPSNRICTIANGSGTMGAAAVTNVAVTCAPAYTISGTISGLGSSSGLVLANGSDTLTVLANATTFSMPMGVASGATYNITIQAHPLLVACTVTNGMGTVAAADVTNVMVTCAPGTESVLYSFSTSVDASYPYYQHLLLAGDGDFYGLTYYGGAYVDGAMFKITPAGVETVLYSFGSGSDGSQPYGSLIQATDGNFYGTTYKGGTNGKGTVFKITPAGVETVLWSFGGGTDGTEPYGSLLQDSDGNFYGMTYEGGVHGAGTVFKITPAGLETVLWSFGGTGDGTYPYSGALVKGADGNFYGITYEGGANNEGTVFKITPAGVETVLWSFGGTGDGTYPYGSLILATDGNFYGMTDDGGTNGTGTAFKITPAGVETVLHSFGGGTDGTYPYGSLVQGNDGNFYGMTYEGGTNDKGTIFQLTPSGTETQVWSFSGAPDGKFPCNDLTIGPDGTLYGLTYEGGANDGGAVIEFD